MGTAEVSPSIARIAEGDQVRMGAIRFVIVNVMNGKIFSTAAFRAVVSVAVTDKFLEFIRPFKRIRLFARTTIPMRMIGAADFFAMPDVFAFTTTKPGCPKRTWHDPKSLAAYLAFLVFATFAKFRTALAATCPVWHGCISRTKRLSANFTDAVPGILFFSKAAFPATKAIAASELGRRYLEGFATPMALNHKARMVGLVSAVTRTVSVLPPALPNVSLKRFFAVVAYFSYLSAHRITCNSTW